MNNSTDIKTALTGYSSTCAATYALTNGIIVTKDMVQSELFGQHEERELPEYTVEKMASAWLAGLFQTDKGLTFKRVEARLDSLEKGDIYLDGKTQKYRDSMAYTAPSKPAFVAPSSIEDLTAAQLSTVVGKEHKVTLSTEQMLLLGLLKPTPAQVKDLQALVDTAQSTKLLYELFDIVDAVILSSTKEETVYQATISGIAWYTSIQRKLDSSVDEGWTYNAEMDVATGGLLVTINHAK